MIPECSSLRLLSLRLAIINDIIFIRDFLLLSKGLNDCIFRVIFDISCEVVQAIIFFGLLGNPRVAIVVFGVLFLDDWGMCLTVQRLCIFLHQLEQVFLEIDEPSGRIEHDPQDILHFR